jgi:hypothetical protein
MLLWIADDHAAGLERVERRAWDRKREGPRRREVNGREVTENGEETILCVLYRTLDARLV